jgi:glycosyltransferase involved in cell wall biosynthesis
MMPRNPSAVSPKLTIGMPVYNGERYLRESLDSLLAQTFTDFELIVSDNASTDGTEAICREYAARDPRIRYVRQNRNCGAAPNFQFVLNEAACELFMWAGADDRWDPGWLAALVELLEPGVSLAFGSSMSFLDDGRTEKRITFKSLKGSRAFRMLRYYLWSETGQKANLIYGIFRTVELREAVAATFGRGDDNRVGLDIILVFTMLQAGRVHIDPGVTLYKRSKLGITGFQPGKFTTWRRAAAFALHLSKLDLVPYLLEHAQKAPPGLTRGAILAAMPVKFGLMVCSGLIPGAALFLRRVRQKTVVEVGS